MKIHFSLLATFCCLSCGVSPGSTQQPIIGGIVDRGRPYVVAVGSDFEGPFCTGTLISPRTVVTAGHCFEPSLPNGGIDRIFIGTSAFSPEITLVVSDAVRDPRYDDFSLSHDLTVLQLAQDAPIQSAPLLRITMNNSPTFIGPELTFGGYGDSNGQGGGFGTRRVVEFPIAAVGPLTVGGLQGDIDSTQFYYLGDDRQTCFGDSGGPGFFILDGVEQHAGVTSFGNTEDCTVDGVDTRTDAPLIAGFIQGEIDANEGLDDCRNNGVCLESCNTAGQVLDPDCQKDHCLADGLCALSCVLPRDPDCLEPGVNHCLNDGICDPTCPSQDEDCLPLCGAGDSCVLSCTAPDPDCVAGVCRDGVLNLGEGCDDGNQDNEDGCNNNCQKPACGDGFVQSTELCDDGNISDNDGCSASCIIEVCGDGVIQSTEQCDDLNGIDNDGCSARCLFEFTGGSCSSSPPGSPLSLLLAILSLVLLRRRRS